MRASELRIGNLVNWDGEIVSITGMYESNDSLPTSFLIRTNLGETHIERIKPIPITEERLVKFGFEKVHRYKNVLDEDEFILDFGRPCKKIYIRDFGSEITLFNHSECDHNQAQFIGRYNYIHELHNIIFALTGEELTIKES